MGSGGVPARYWLRLVCALAISLVSTVVTLPERLVLAPVLAARRRRGRSAPVVCVLGYFRSGTTHLHYVLSCDPGFVTPRWHQMLAPQGFVLSWSLLRWALIPFLSSTRPQDDVAYGPEYPAEDDFGLCNWAGIGTLPGRVVAPGAWDHFKRYQTLKGLSAGERARFARVQRGLVDKLAMVGGPGRMVLLKSPPHTARLDELRRVLGGDGALPDADVRFIHVHREPGAVLKSNVAMHARLSVLMVQPPPGDEVVRQRVIEEYDATERAFLEQAKGLGKGRLVRVRYEDLVADPIGEIARAYAELGLAMSPAFVRRAVEYLESVREYRSASQRAAGAVSGVVEGAGAREPETPAELCWMRGAFGHDAPAVTRREARERAIELGLLDPRPIVGEPPLLNGWAGALAGALACMSVWAGLALWSGTRWDWLLWPMGLVIGLCGLRGRGRGSGGLGVWAGVLTCAGGVAMAYPLSWLTHYATRDPVPWDHVWLTTVRNFLATNTMVWLVLGVLTAYRTASRVHVRPPGM